MRSKLTLVRLLLTGFILTHTTLAQALNELMPWIPDREKVALGMDVATFQRVNKNAKSPSLPQGDGKLPADFTGGFYERKIPIPAIGSSEDMILYSFVKGKLAAVYWANKKGQTLQLTETIRNVLLTTHGKPVRGHTTKMQNGAFVKAAVEAYSAGNSDSLKLILTSAANGVEVHAVDFAIDKRATLAAVISSYEKHAATLRKQGLKEINDPGKTIDFLRDLAAKD